MTRIIVLIFFFIPQISYLQQSELFGDLQIGKHSVGFKIINAVDYSRGHSRQLNFKGERINDNPFRPIQINVWYPASPKTNDTKMLVKDYYYIKAQVSHPRTLSSQEKDEIDSRSPTYSNTITPSDRDKLLNLSTDAFYGIEPEKNNYPVLILLSLSPTDTHILSEYFASHGYVVLSVPFHKEVGNYFNYSESWVAAIKDVQFSLNQIKSAVNVDLTQIGIIGASHGGNIAPSMQMECPSVKGVVSLDGMERWNAYKGFINKTNYGRIDFKKMNVPYLIFEAQRDDYDYSFYDEKAIFADKIYINDLGLSHGYFSAISYVMYEAIAHSTYEGSTNISNQNPAKKFEIICNYTLNFFDDLLKNKSSFDQFINDFSKKDSLLIRRKLAKDIPPNKEDLVSILVNQGMEDFQLTFNQYEDDINPRTIENVWKDLFDKNDEIAGILFEFISETFPDYSWHYYLLLTSAIKENDKKTIEEYHPIFLKVLELDPRITEELRKNIKANIKSKLQIFTELDNE